MPCLAQAEGAQPVHDPCEERLFFACQYASIGVGHLSLEGRWLRFNRMLCQITGCSREQLLGRPLRDLVLPEDRDIDRVQLEDLLAGRIPSYTVEKRLVRPHGSPPWMQLTTSAVRPPEGTPAFLLVVMEDISARKEAETDRATLAAIVRQSADAIIGQSPDGTITSWNLAAERLFGYRAQEVLGRQVSMLAPAEKADDVGAVLKRVLRGDLVAREEAVRIRKDGARIYVALSASPILNTDGKLIGVARIVRDVTKLKMAEQTLQATRQRLADANTRLEEQVRERTARLRETLAEIEHISYSIIHDMRAPLRAIEAYGELIESDAANRLSGESREFLARTRRAATRMDRLIRDVLSYSRLVRVGLELRSVNTGELLRGIVETYPAFQSPRVRIRIAPHLPWVQGNEAALTQCFANLLDNAVKSVRPGEPPQVEIKAAVNNGRARIFVADNGVGIPKELHERIFRVFERGSNAQEGTGIGLAIVRKAAERMGGKAGVESEPGQGSRFWVELPLALQPEACPGGRATDPILEPARRN